MPLERNVGGGTRLALDSASLSSLPPLRYSHLVRMTDTTGLFQHALRSSPDLRYGYCIDDNARAAIVAAQLTMRGNVIGTHLLPTYLAFMEHCQRPDGVFRNFVNADGSFAEAEGSPDSQGRAIWAAGVLAGLPLATEIRERALALLERAVPVVRAQFLRTQAFMLLGLVAFLNGTRHSPHALHDHVALQRYRALAQQLADSLVTAFERTATPDWPWFEPVLTYCNARLPQALFAASTVVPDSRYRAVAERSLAFLQGIHFPDGWLQLVGCHGWYERAGMMALYDQQPVDAGALTEAFCTAAVVTGKKPYRELARLCLDWYHGYNSEHRAMYIPETGGCYDGLKPGAVNENQGAESMLSYYLARHAYEALLSTEG